VDLTCEVNHRGSSEEAELKIPAFDFMRPGAVLARSFIDVSSHSTGHPLGTGGEKKGSRRPVPIAGSLIQAG